MSRRNRRNIQQSNETNFFSVRKENFSYVTLPNFEFLFNIFFIWNKFPFVDASNASTVWALTRYATANKRTLVSDVANFKILFWKQKNKELKKKINTLNQSFDCCLSLSFTQSRLIVHVIGIRLVFFFFFIYFPFSSVCKIWIVFNWICVLVCTCLCTRKGIRIKTKSANMSDICWDIDTSISWFDCVQQTTTRSEKENKKRDNKIRILKLPKTLSHSRINDRSLCLVDFRQMLKTGTCFKFHVIHKKEV